MEMHQRQGYATEAVGALLSWAFQGPAVQMVVADTLPGLTPSIRVMENPDSRSRRLFVWATRYSQKNR
jgi:hypothetical protein